MKQRPVAATWSLVGTLALITFGAISTGGLRVVPPELLKFFSGEALSIPVSASNNIAEMITYILGTAVFDFVGLVAAFFVVCVVTGTNVGRHSVSDLLQLDQEKPLFKVCFLLVLLEELFARWLFLGVLRTYIPFLQGTAGFYLLVMLGNSIWAYVHLKNYKDPKQRKILRVLPQFVAGLFFSYIYLKFGLLGAVLMHFASNAILFCLSKVQETNHIDGLITAYSGIGAAVAYATMTRPISDARLWLVHPESTAIPGWQKWDYLRLVVFVAFGLAAVFSVLLYDRPDLQTSRNNKSSDVSLPAMLVGLLIVLAAYAGLTYLLFWGLGFITKDIALRVASIAVLLTCLQKCRSASAVSRAFWTSLPSSYVFLMSLQALSFAAGLELLAAYVVVSAPLAALKRYDT